MYQIKDLLSLTNFRLLFYNLRVKITSVFKSFRHNENIVINIANDIMEFNLSCN